MQYASQNAAFNAAVGAALGDKDNFILLKLY